MNSLEIKLLKELSPSEFKLYRYAVVRAGERGVVHGITRDEIESDCSLGYTTVYEGLKTLKTKGLIEFNGKKKFLKILA